MADMEIALSVLNLVVGAMWLYHDDKPKRRLK